MRRDERWDRTLRPAMLPDVCCSSLRGRIQPTGCTRSAITIDNVHLSLVCEFARFGRFALRPGAAFQLRPPVAQPLTGVASSPLAQFRWRLCPCLATTRAPLPGSSESRPFRFCSPGPSMSYLESAQAPQPVSCDARRAEASIATLQPPTSRRPRRKRPSTRRLSLELGVPELQRPVLSTPSVRRVHHVHPAVGDLELPLITCLRVRADLAGEAPGRRRVRGTPDTPDRCLWSPARAGTHRRTGAAARSSLEC